MFKKIILATSLFAFSLFALYLFGVYQNNRDVAHPQSAQLELQHEASIKWLLANEEEMFLQVNPMLWWMLYESNKILPDSRISTMLEQYYSKYQQVVNGPWGPLFGAQKRSYLAAYAVEGLPYYNQHFLYSLNCAQGLADDIDVVAQQNEASFCHQMHYIYRPACITHQLMGINFLHKKQCGTLSTIDEVTQSLQSDIELQLTWDIRVVDVYLQRVMMLLITGAESHVKPVWIQQVLDHQLEDGGWGDFASLSGRGSGRSIGFSSRIISLGEEKSSFHATAQGVYILSYLLSESSKS